MSSSKGVRHCLAIDYGSYTVKYGVEGDGAKMIRTAGLVISRRIIENLLRKADDIIIGDDIDRCIAQIRIIKKNIEQLHYPIRHGIIKGDDRKGWRISEKITEQILLSIYGRIHPTIEEDSDGFYIVFSLNAMAPRNMYEGFFEIFRRFVEKGLVKAITAIQQPLATAMASAKLVCLVVESGHGNTQIVPIVERIIRSAIVPLNRGGVNANALTREILKDAGYGDLALNDEIVRR